MGILIAKYQKALKLFDDYPTQEVSLLDLESWSDNVASVFEVEAIRVSLIHEIDRVDNITCIRHFLMLEFIIDSRSSLFPGWRIEIANELPTGQELKDVFEKAVLKFEVYVNEG